MKRMQLYLICVLAFFISQCTTEPTIEELRPALAKGLHWQDMTNFSHKLYPYLDSVLELAEWKITNRHSIAENQYYILEFNGTVRVIKSFYQIKGLKGPLLDKPSSSRLVVNPQAGEMIPFSGEAVYEATENGWRLKELKADINYKGVRVGRFILN